MQLVHKRSTATFICAHVSPCELAVNWSVPTKRQAIFYCMLFPFIESFLLGRRGSQLQRVQLE